MLRVFKYQKMYPVRTALNSLGFGYRGMRRRYTELAAMTSFIADHDKLTQIFDVTRSERHDDDKAPPDIFRNIRIVTDTFPVQVYRHKRREGEEDLQSLTYNGKYACHVMKCQAYVDPHGVLLADPGIQLGTVADINLYRHHMPFELLAGEQIMADLAYKSKELPEVVTPHKKQAKQDSLPRPMLAFNALHGERRAGVEHRNFMIKNVGSIGSRSRCHIFYDASPLARAVRMRSALLALRDRHEPPRSLDPKEGGDLRRFLMKKSPSWFEDLPEQGWICL